MSVVNIKWSKKRLTIGVKIGIIHKNDCMCMTGLGSGHDMQESIKFLTTKIKKNKERVANKRWDCLLILG